MRKTPLRALSDGAVLTRCVVWTCLGGAVLGASYGLVVGIAEYPASAVPAVMLYVSALGALAATLLGLLAGSAVLLLRRAHR